MTRELWKPDVNTWSRMFKAVPGKRDFARRLLGNLTQAELLLWSELSKLNVGTKSRPRCPWRPQVVIKGWIVDFYSDLYLTALEIDGEVHNQADQSAKDALKDRALSHFGIRVLRYRNQEVYRNPAALAEQIDRQSQYPKFQS